MPRKRIQRREGEYRFKIDAWTPAKIPMIRLGEYIQNLAQVLGEPAHVHFRKILPGSTVIVHDIEHEAIPKVLERVERVKFGDAPGDVMRAYKAMNKMLRDDNAVGTLKNGKVILPFPGRDEVREEFAVVRQHGSVDGTLTGVTGSDETAHITLLIDHRPVSGFSTNRAIAKQLATKWDEPVRLFGRGRWRRDADGNWQLLDFKVENFESLNSAPLADALADLRSTHAEWTDDAYSELLMMRKVPRSPKNGGH